jgi:hypothetical protein
MNQKQRRAQGKVTTVYRTFPSPQLLVHGNWREAIAPLMTLIAPELSKALSRPDTTTGLSVIKMAHPGVGLIDELVFVVDHDQKRMCISLPGEAPDLEGEGVQTFCDYSEEDLQAARQQAGISISVN